ncbi:MAG: tripartite tricarboxylate transporter substrate binding protein [Betaproteobacteria bacterium]|nr:tripartite tricarboxylate transporter substrate binding protein [Betaproteobacteria bacterium]
MTNRTSRPPATGRRSLVTGLCALICALSGAQHAQAQAYPVKPVRIITGFAGGSDLMARLVAQQLSPALGQQVFVEQRLGAAGSIGFEAAAKSPPDGYTLLLGAITLVTNPFIHRRIGYDPIKDFAPIMLLSTIPNGLFVHPSVPARSLRELVQLARKSPGKIAYGSGGAGSANHLAAESLQSLAGIRFTHVPYKSATLGLVGAMSGDVDMVITVVSSGAPYVKDGRMRGLAVLDKKRSATMPEVPTAAGAGVPGLVAVNWYALLAPAGTPRAIVDQLYAATVKVMSAAEIQSRLRATGGEPESGTPEQTAEFIRAEYARWSKVIREAGIKSE